MLQPKHLAIVRAALTYWDEEMSGADQTIYQHYLHSQDADVKFDAVDVIQTRRFFSSAKLLESVSRTIELPENSVILTTVTD